MFLGEGKQNQGKELTVAKSELTLKVPNVTIYTNLIVRNAYHIEKI